LRKELSRHDTLRYGLSVGGRPRFDIQPEPYRLTRDDLDSLRRYLALATKHEQLLTDMSSKLRRALFTAGHHYEGHYACAVAFPA
jgi:hypothetical protein